MYWYMFDDIDQGAPNEAQYCTKGNVKAETESNAHAHQHTGGALGTILLL
jgi:hypothetical protein